MRSVRTDGKAGSLSRVGFEAYLVPEAVLERLAAELDEEWMQQHIAPNVWPYREMRFEQALMHLPQQLPTEHQDAMRIYYTRLYWANRLVAAARRDLGPDPGLEQWAHKILEAAPDAAVDWEIVAEIFKAIDRSSPT